MEKQQNHLKDTLGNDFPITPCTECQGERVVAMSSSYLVKLTPNLEASYQSTPVYALVCKECGYTTYFAQKPEEL